MEFEYEGLTITNIIENLSNININNYEKQEITNKLWKAFLNNDGSMTLFLQSFFGKDNLKMKLITNQEIERDNTIISNFEKIFDKKFDTDSFIYRLIEFIADDANILVAVSIWSKEIFDNIYEDETRPIGLVLAEKEVEYFKKTNYIIQDKTIYRFSSYKMNNKLGFLLLEIINAPSLNFVLGEL
jgi:hypothetical protein